MKIREIISSGKNLEYQFSDGSTLLMIACAHNSLADVKELLNASANSNHVRHDGMTSLMIACYNGFFRIFDELMKHNPKINAQSELGWTALHYACLKYRSQLDALYGHDYSHLPIVKALAQNGANINIKSTDDQSAFITAISRGNTDLALYLLEIGAEYRQKTNKEGCTPLMVAAEQGDLLILKKLIGRGAEINDRDDNGRTAIFAAIRGQHTDAIKLLLNAGADVRVRDNDGDTPLTFSEWLKNDEAVTLISNPLRNYSVSISPNDRILCSNPRRETYNLRKTPKALELWEAIKHIRNARFYDSAVNLEGEGIRHYYTLACDDQAVVDRFANLMWMRSGSDTLLSWEGAQKYILNLNYNNLLGFSNWRIPTFEEAMSLIESDRNTAGLYINKIFDDQQEYIWTCDQMLYGADDYIAVLFDDGRFSYFTKSRFTGYIRAVRSLD